MQIRRWFALRKLERVRDVWPIKQESERPPANWPGWPEGKKFAFLLTHDVESQRGLERVQQLAELEMEYGFRSQFNFIPEGPYTVPPELRHWLTDRGFEVGVHDLHHDGRLYSSRADFAKRAERINHYLREWGAVGFRSGFMLRRLDWLHDLDVVYDGSTFDTDPFEPQPEGCQTIFPFWVARPERAGAARNGRAGYVELPYTLAQDSSLFLLLKEKTGEIWERKLNWIVEHGGMALVNIHPDYIDFTERSQRSTEYPVSRIRELLERVSRQHAGAYWAPLPRQIATWYADTFGYSATQAAEPETTTVAALQNAEEEKAVLAGKRVGVLLYSYYPADPRPRRAAEALAAAGMEVDLFCLRESDDEPTREVVHGVNIFRLSMRRRRGSKFVYFAQYGRFIAASFLFLVRRARSQRYSVVHVHNMPDVLVFSALIPKLLGSAVILDLHDPMPELMMSIYGFAEEHWAVSLFRVLERWSIGFADLALTPNIAFQQIFESRSCRQGKVKIVMNSPESDIFDPDAAPGTSAPERDGEFRVMHHGSIVHRHGVDLLVEAVARVRAEIPGVRLDIYGARTSFLDEVLEVAKRQGVADIVRFHGAKNQTEIAQAIRDCHVGVVPNRKSPFTDLNFPTRLFEYLAMHRPVIAPGTKGIRDYFGPEDIVLFEAGSVEDLAQRIRWVHDHREEVAQTIERGREVYRRNLWSAEKARFVKQVSELVTENGGSRPPCTHENQSEALPTVTVKL